MKAFTRPRGIVVEPNKYYKVNKIAEMLDVSPETLKREIRDGKLKAVKIRTNTVVLGIELEKYIQENICQDAEV